jgi:drug/metabolite transporter (DMT)-like permease
MRKALLQLHLAIFLAGFTAILGRLILLNEAVLVTWRLAITVLLMVILLGWTLVRKPLPMLDRWRMLGIGFLIAFHWVMFYGSVKYGNVSVAVVCLSAAGFFTAFLDPWINGRRIEWMEVALGVLAIVGIYVIFDFHPEFELGMIFGMLSALGSALFPIFNKQMLVHYPPRVLTFYVMLGGLIALLLVLPAYLHFFPEGGNWPNLTDAGWLFLLASVCTVYCFHLQLTALQQLSAFTANLSYNLEPVYSIILAFWLFHENQHLNTSFYVGVGLIMAAVGLQMVRIKWKQRSYSTSVYK